MKKAGLAVGCILIVLTVLLPAGVILAACSGYTFKLASYPVFSVITALAAISAAFLFTACKDLTENGAVAALLALAFPLSLVNAAFYLFKSGSFPAAAALFLYVCICCYLTARYAKPLALKIVALVLSGLMALPIGFFAFIALLFGNIGQNTVVWSVASPDGTYRAEVIDSDQGALGGDTLVDVYENKGFDAFIFQVEKTPQTVYYGNWGEFEDMDIYWKSDNCLIINSREYILK